MSNIAGTTVQFIETQFIILKAFSMLLKCCQTVCIKGHCRQTQKVKVVPHSPFYLPSQKSVPPTFNCFWKLYAPPPSPALNTSPPSYNCLTIRNIPYGCIVFALSINWACKLALEPGLTGRASLQEEAGRGFPCVRI